MTEERRMYERPRAVRLGEQACGAGDCDTGSGDSVVCGNVGNSAVGQCGNVGNGAVNMCNLTGNSAVGDCNTGNDPYHT